MAWEGYLSYDGTEIINVARTEAYARDLDWFKPLYNNSLLPRVLGRSTGYTTPSVDEAPWYDPDVPESNGFFGAYPIDVAGLENSSRASDPIEFTTEGGLPGRLRHGTRTGVFSVVLIGASEAAVKYGRDWLARALLGSACGKSLATRQAQGADLLFLAAEPKAGADQSNTWRPPGGTLSAGPFRSDPSDEDVMIADPDIPFDELARDSGDADILTLAVGGTSVFDPDDVDIVTIVDPASGEQVVGPLDDPAIIFLQYVRRWQNFAVNVGPNVSVQRTLPCGGAFWMVQFTGVAGSPYEFSSERPILQAYGEAGVPSPWVPGVEPGQADVSGAAFEDEECESTVWDPIYDPEWPALVAPPPPPTVETSSWMVPDEWTRYRVTIPASNVPIWGDSAPIVTIHATETLRGVRIRFYDDVDGEFDPDVTPCDYTGDLVALYIPAGGSMILDCAKEEVYIVTSLGRRRRANSLLLSTDGTPPRWPTISCGIGYVMTIDQANASPRPVVDLSLTARRL